MAEGQWATQASLRTIGPIWPILLSFAVFAGQLCAGNYARYVVFAQQRVEAGYVAVQDFLQAAQLSVDAGGEVVEDGVRLLCGCSRRTGDDGREVGQFAVEPGRVIERIL